ncbi:hypothetical protein CYY_000867 [Polysphondylium violaceum]|uniref:F-box domain-containing protein n=1 Tax=Polysphondylium violaceum TaxID=133409 RepID=A0A8J4V8H3_9MYCE|nr:hypothetical protein CYY_000867 [Polysphondylium violaceum]
MATTTTTTTTTTTSSFSAVVDVSQKILFSTPTSLKLYNSSNSSLNNIINNNNNNNNNNYNITECISISNNDNNNSSSASEMGLFKGINNSSNKNSRSLTNILNSSNKKSKKDIKQCWFDKLPEEVIVKIFKELEEEKDIYKISLVCSQWNSITQTNEIWMNLYKKKSFHKQLLKHNVHEIDFKCVLKLKSNAQSNWKNGRFKCSVLQGHKENISSIIFNGSKIVSGSYDSTIKIWDYYTHECTDTLMNKTTVTTMQFDHSNKKIITGSNQGFVNIWNLETQTLESSVKAHYGFIGCLKGNYNSSIFCTGSKDKEISVWDIDRGCLVRKMGSHRMGISNIEWCNVNPNHLISTGGDTAKVWDVETGQCIRSLTGHAFVINNSCLSVKNQMVATGGEGSHVTIWDLRQNNYSKLVNTASTIYSLQYEPELNSMVTGNKDNMVKCWKVDTSSLEQTFMGHTSPVNIIHYDRHHIVSGSLDSNLWVWNYDQSSSSRKVGNFHKLEGHTDMINCAYIDETKIISGSFDNRIRIWDFANQKKENRCSIM